MDDVRTRLAEYINGAENQICGEWCGPGQPWPNCDDDRHDEARELLAALAEEEVIEAHKLFSYTEGENVVIDLVTDTNPVRRMRLTTDRPEGIGCATLILESVMQA